MALFGRVVCENGASREDYEFISINEAHIDEDGKFWHNGVQYDATEDGVFYHKIVIHKGTGTVVRTDDSVEFVRFYDPETGEIDKEGDIDIEASGTHAPNGQRPLDQEP